MSSQRQCRAWTIISSLTPVATTSQTESGTQHNCFTPRTTVSSIILEFPPPTSELHRTHNTPIGRVPDRLARKVSGWRDPSTGARHHPTWMPTKTPWDAMHSACFTTLKPTNGTCHGGVPHGGQGDSNKTGGTDEVQVARNGGTTYHGTHEHRQTHGIP